MPEQIAEIIGMAGRAPGHAGPGDKGHQHPPDIQHQRQDIFAQVVTIAQDVVLDDAVDVVDNEAHIQQRVDEVPAGVAVVDWVILGVGVTVQRLWSLLEAGKAVSLQESSQHRMVVPRPQVDQPSGRILQLVSEP